MKKILLAIIFGITSLLFFVAQAQETSITFPIAELGNCNNKQECKTFCSKEENFESCTAFAEAHNLLPKAVKEKKDKLKELIKQKGPGGCGNKQACEAYCSSEENLEECLEFGKKHGLISKADEEKAGRFLPLIRQGQTPGGCKSKEACEAFCHEEGNQGECLDFAVKIGAISPEQAQKAKKLNGQGPGGCKGASACQAFCDQEANQETCFNFAKENGLIKAEEIEHIKEGVGQMRMGLNNAPEQIKLCLRESVDEDSLNQIESGELMPTAEIGQNVKVCFEKFRPELEAQRQREFKANPKVEECVKTAVGEEVLSNIKTGEAPPTKATAERMRGCFEQFSGRDDFSEQGREMENLGAPKQPQKENLGRLSEEVKKCLAEHGGQELLDQTASGQAPELKEENIQILQKCMGRQMQKEGLGPMSGSGKDPDFYEKPSKTWPMDPRMPGADNLYKLNSSTPPQSEFKPYPKPPQGTFVPPTEGMPRPPEAEFQSPDGNFQNLPAEVKGAATSRLPGFIKWLLGK